MKRANANVFEPETAVQPPNEGDPGQREPAPGPTAAWTARGIILALSQLATDERCARLQETVARRLDAVTLVLDNFHDPHNGSAVLRSCDAFGVQRIHVLRGHEKFAVHKVVARGSQRWVDVIEHIDPAQIAKHLKSQGYRLLVTHPEGRLTPQDLGLLPRIALVLGNEHEGVGEVLTSLADDTVRIPMCGFVESLNVSVTAAILLQAACQGRPGDLSAERAQNVYARWLRNTVPRADEVLSALVPC